MVQASLAVLTLTFGAWRMIQAGRFLADLYNRIGGNKTEAGYSSVSDTRVECMRARLELSWMVPWSCLPRQPLNSSQVRRLFGAACQWFRADRSIPVLTHPEGRL